MDCGQNLLVLYINKKLYKIHSIIEVESLINSILVDGEMS